MRREQVPVSYSVVPREGTTPAKISFSFRTGEDPGIAGLREMLTAEEREIVCIKDDGYISYNMYGVNPLAEHSVIETVFYALTRRKHWRTRHFA